MRHILAIALLLGSLAIVPAGTAAPTDPKVDRIFQFFASSGEVNRPNLGAYLWIPPHTPRVRAVMVGIHNGLPINILQSPPVRAVCRKHGIAQILFTPWAKDIGSVMMKDLTYDVTDPQRTAIYDGYLRRLADAFADCGDGRVAQGVSDSSRGVIEQLTIVLVAFVAPLRHCDAAPSGCLRGGQPPRRHRAV